MRGKRLAFNTVSSLLYQIVAVLCGFVLPRLILKTYGSDVNGLVNSVNQYLQIIAVLDLGVGAVISSSLYKPLAKKDDKEISKILKSAKKYFNNIAKILFVYILLLPLFFVFLVNNSFDFIFTATLIFAMGISSFAQYYFGIVNQILLSSDQKSYINNNVHIFTLVLNTLVCSFLIILGASIQFVKLITSLIFLIRPLYLRWYVNRHYNIIKDIKYDKEPIKQKWNGIYQHFAAIVLDSTDTIVLSMFSDFASVSIYSVYYLVVHGIRQLVQSLTNGLQSLFGNMYANKEFDKLSKVFNLSEWVVHNLTVLVFGCTLVLIIPFVMVYTDGINDANYIVPLFGFLLTISQGFYCLRLPYHLLIKSVGHYKETQINYIIAVLLNIIISIFTVKWYGLIGVAIGTLIAMFYQTVWMANYCNKHIMNNSNYVFIKQIIIDIIIIIIGVLFTNGFSLSSVSYLSFVILGLKVFIIWLFILIIVNLLIYRDNFKLLYKRLKRK